MTDDLTHVDDSGTARMVDVSGKAETRRRAVAACVLRFSSGTLARVMSGALPKGPVLETARVAGIAGAKRTADLIPMCHPLRLTEVKLDFKPVDDRTLEIVAQVTAMDRTGVEMEALCAVSVAALTVYDMVKAIDRGMVVESTRLLKKSGGRSGDWTAEKPDP